MQLARLSALADRSPQQKPVWRTNKASCMHTRPQLVLSSTCQPVALADCNPRRHGRFAACICGRRPAVVGRKAPVVGVRTGQHQQGGQRLPAGRSLVTGALVNESRHPQSGQQRSVDCCKYVGQSGRSSTYRLPQQLGSAHLAYLLSVTSGLRRKSTGEEILAQLLE